MTEPRYHLHGIGVIVREMSTVVTLRCQNVRCFHRFTGAFGRWPDGQPVVNHCPKCDTAIELEEAA